MDNLPTEIIENILDRLTIEAALQAKQVCRSWRIFLRSKTDKVGLLFAESYFDINRNKLYYGDIYDPIRGKINYNYSTCDRLDNKVLGKLIPEYKYMYNMLGSCNGLVCMGSRFTNWVKPFLICNPITGEAVYVPQPDDTSIAQDCNPSKICGFGYCHSKNEYKIVMMHNQGQGMSHLLVYTIGGGGWRSKGSIHISPFNLTTSTTSMDSATKAAGIYANGALHWLYRTSNNINRITIIAFDLEDEKFKFIYFSHFEDLKYVHGLQLLGGNNLYLVCSTLYYPPYCKHIWAYNREIINTTNTCDLKENYDNENSWHWIKEFSIERQKPYWEDQIYFEPLAVTRNNELILRNQNYPTLYCYDHKTSAMNQIFDGGAGCHMINVIPHANSIVSIL